MYTSDQQLAALNARRIEELPQRASFEFVGIDRNGRAIDCRTRYNMKSPAHGGNFLIVEDVTGMDVTDQIIGWRCRHSVALFLPVGPLRRPGVTDCSAWF